LEEAYNQKLTRAIGVSNFNVQSLANILSFATVRPAVNQVEVHVYNQQPELIKFCKRFKIVVTAYSPLAMGGLPQSYMQNHKVDIFSDLVLNEVAKTHKRSVAQVAMNFLYFELGLVVIPKTERKERLVENIGWLNFRLSKEEAEKIRAIN
jgi:aldehyde reductase